MKIDYTNTEGTTYRLSHVDEHVLTMFDLSGDTDGGAEKIVVFHGDGSVETYTKVFPPTRCEIGDAIDLVADAFDAGVPDGKALLAHTEALLTLVRAL